MWCHEKMHVHVGEILTVFAIVLAALWFRRRAANRSREAAGPLPPGPCGLPLVGYLPFLGTDLPREFTKLSHLYGPIYKLWLGTRLCVVVSSPSLVRQIVRDQDAVFANHDLSISGFIASFGGNDILLTPYGPEWRKLRKIFAQQMQSNTILDNLYSLRREEVNKSIRNIFHNIEKNTPVDVGSLAYMTVNNAVIRMFWGKGMDHIVDGVEFRKTVSELMVLVGKPNVFELFPALSWLDVQGIERDTKRVTRVFESMFDAAIERKKRKMAVAKEKGVDQSEGERKDFLQFLLETHEKDDSAESISMAQLKALLVDLVVGGTDTTGTAVEWAMAELLKHPEAMNEVHEELTQVVGLSNMVEESHLPKLTYLNAVVKETLRLHPTNPFLLPRYPSQNTTLGGYFVPKGAKIFINAWAIHRDPSYWEDPLEFRPERFLNNDAVKFDYSGNNFHYLPFGSGRRICAGIPLAERMLYFVLASFLHAFNWKLPPGAKHDFSYRFGIVVKKREPLVVIPSPRLSNLELYKKG